ncbi:MAG: GtrA family protein [Firmicutes bacterium]|nr:GtrA family protein [Bacillota bacterium]
MQKIKKLLKIVFSREFILQVIKFGIAGGTTSIIDWGVLAICVRVLHMDSMASNIFAFAISVTYNYWANAKFVFDFDESKGKKRVFITFVCLAAVGFGINELVMWLGDKVLHYDPLLVKVAGIALAAIFNFFSRKLILEKKKPAEETAGPEAAPEEEKTSEER